MDSKSVSLMKKLALGLGIILASQAVYHKAAAVITDTDVQTVSAVGNGVTTSYTIGFQFQANSELRVYLQSESTTPYTRTLLVYGAGAGKYTYGSGDPTTTVVLGTAPTTSQRVIIKRVTSLTQQVDYVETDAFPAENHEEQMDRMEQSLQELDSAVSYKIGLSTVSTYTTPTYPDPVADKWALYNHAGSDLTIGPSGSLTTGDVPQYIGTGWSTYNVTNGVIAGLAAHIADVANPHVVTATQVGKDTAQWNASKIQGATVDPANIGNGKILSYNSGTGNLEYVAGSLLPIGTAETVINVNSAGTDIEYDFIKNANIDAAAGIVDTKLATISTASKVSNSATTATASNTMSAIMARDASGQVAASTFTGNLVGNVTGNVTGNLTGDVTGNVSGSAGSVSGNAATATALAANPTDCGAGTKATAIDASGNLTCSSVANADLAGSIAASKLVGTDIATVGTVTSGTWNGTKVSEAYGGTNQATYTTGDILYASGANTLSKLAIGSASSVLKGGTTPSWGSVAGGDGVQQNLVGLDSAYVANNTTDRDAEVSVGNWTAYADAAGTAPVDMTGGSPNTTCTRVGASTMNGAGYFVMTLTTAATRQGEGCSELVYIPPAYRGAMLEFTFPFTTTGTITEDDIKLYAYDVTNSEVITPYWPAKVLGAGPGRASAVFPLKTTTAQVRVGLHVARAVNTGAVTVLYDDVSLSPQVATYGMAGSNSQSYTPTLTGFGTATGVEFTYSRTGQFLNVDGKFTSGTSTAVEARISLPTGLTAADSTVIASLRQAGVGVSDTASLGGSIVVLSEPSVAYVTLGKQDTASTGGLSKRNGNGMISTGEKMSVKFSVPIAGWDANVTMSASSTFKISSYLASGTRVTTTPTKLGEYRAYTQDASTSTGTDNAPTATPSVADGMRIYAVPYASAGTSGETNRYEIFIGKNKHYKAEVFSNAGRTGWLSFDYLVGVNSFASTNKLQKGLKITYDPTTGTLIVDAIAGPEAPVANYIGDSIPTSGGSITSVSNAYFDITVSENALAVGVQAPRSEVWVYTANGYGSTNTAIRRWTTTGKSVGTAITYADSSTAGGSFTINEDGTYAISYVDEFNTSSHFGVSLNSSQLTTSIASITAADRLVAITTPGANYSATAQTTLFLPAGSVIRAHAAADTTGANTWANSFRITKVSN